MNGDSWSLDDEECSAPVELAQIQNRLSLRNRVTSPCATGHIFFLPLSIKSLPSPGKRGK
jgi:hypothetical protein